MVQIANSRRFGVVGDRVQRATRQIKKQVVVRLVGQSYGIAFQVMEINLTSPQVTHRHLPSVLPVLAGWENAQRPNHQKKHLPPGSRGPIPPKGGSTELPVGPLPPAPQPPY